jgi:hypothetical protein
MRPSAANSDRILRSVLLTAEEYPRPWHDAHVKTDQRLMVLDTASLYFRAFFGIPEILAATVRR